MLQPRQPARYQLCVTKSRASKWLCKVVAQVVLQKDAAYDSCSYEALNKAYVSHTGVPMLKIT